MIVARSAGPSAASRRASSASWRASDCRPRRRKSSHDSTPAPAAAASNATTPSRSGNSSRTWRALSHWAAVETNSQRTPASCIWKWIWRALERGVRRDGDAPGRQDAEVGDHPLDAVLAQQADAVAGPDAGLDQCRRARQDVGAVVRPTSGPGRRRPRLYRTATCGPSRSACRRWASAMLRKSAIGPSLQGFIALRVEAGERLPGLGELASAAGPAPTGRRAAARTRGSGRGPSSARPCRRTTSARRVGGEAVAVDVDDVDVAGPQGDAFVEDSRAFVDEGVDRPLDDLLGGDRPRRDPGLAGRLLGEPLRRPGSGAGVRPPS